MRARAGLCAGMLFALITTQAIAQATATSERRFPLTGHGHFVIQVPRDWKDQVRQSPGQLPPTITLGPESGRPFRVLLTPVWPSRKDHPAPAGYQIRNAVEQSARQAHAQAAERLLTVVEFQGRSGPGYYFSATDRAPRPGEYKFMTQGILRVGELSVSFTILTNEGQEQVVEQMLDALQGAVQVRA